MNIMIRKLGLAHFSAISLPPTEFVTLAAEAGFARVGLRLCAPFTGAPHYPLRAGSAEIRDLSRKCADLGIEVYDIEAVVIDATFDAGALVRALEAAAELGAKRLSVAGDDENGHRLADNVSSLCEMASKFGLSVDMENMGWRTIATYEQADALVAATAAKNAGVLVDALHFFRNGGKLEQLRAGISRVQSVQLCDVRGLAPTTAEGMVAEARSGRYAPGEGELPLQELLAAIGDTVFVSIEVPLADPAGTPHDHVHHLMTATRRLLTPAGQG